MKRALAVISTVALTVLMLGATPAYADNKTVVHSDQEAAPNGVVDLYTDVDIIRDTNGTTNNVDDDRFDFGGSIITNDVQTDNWWSHWVNGVWVVERVNHKVLWTEITIQKLDLSGQNNYVAEWQDRINSDATAFYLPSTGIDWNKHPRVKVEVHYENGWGSNTVTKSAWLSGWED